MRAVMASNSNVGGNVISENGSWSIVRGLGLIENLDDIRNIVVGSHNGTPIFAAVAGRGNALDAIRELCDVLRRAPGRNCDLLLYGSEQMREDGSSPFMESWE
jgi:hypothetical protein